MPINFITSADVRAALSATTVAWVWPDEKVLTHRHRFKGLYNTESHINKALQKGVDYK